ncbi:zinc finger protein 366-like [Anoplophora glabripennis]|uniref:zinc finger protein 366-like n=1 Tax=Anoplophora glabripennis TaxID=217634 RepID=UPI000874AC39|nr:zinc finger protein 366-like [Anoplophora glabripennis]
MENWQYTPPSFNPFIKTEEIEIKSEEYEEKPKELSKIEMDIKFETFGQEEHKTLKNENISVKLKESKQESLQHHLKELCDFQDVKETKIHISLSGSDSDAENTSIANSVQNTWKCSLCDFDCNSKEVLRKHITSTHKNPSNLFICSLCAYTTEYLHKLVSHKTWHKNLADAQCHVLDVPKTVVERKICSESKEEKCAICGCKYKNRNELGEHITAAHKDPSDLNMFKCNICDYLTVYFHVLVKHVSNHNSFPDTDWYLCNKCDYRTLHKYYFKQHVFRHTSDSKMDMIKCGECPFQSISHTVLRRHMLKHKSQWYGCEICDYKTIHRSHLRWHMLKHKRLSEVEVYECSLCEFHTKWRTSLMGHMLRHAKGASCKRSLRYCRNQC